MSEQPIPASKHSQALNACINTNPVHDGILIISHDFHRAGAQINILNGGKVVKEKYNKYLIFVALKDGEYREAFESVGDEVYVLDLSDNEHFQINTETETLLAELQKRGIKQCICNTIVSGSLTPLLSQMGFQFINLIHELPFSVNIFNFHDGMHKIRQYAKSIVFSSEYARQSYIDHYQYDIEKTVVKAQGCYFKQSLIEKKTQVREKLRQSLLLPSNSIIVLNCGYLYHRKGPDVFLSLAKKILSQGLNQLRFHFVWLGGNDFQSKSWFIHDKEKLGINNNVHYVDFVEEPNTFYAGADAFVLTSREDPLPTVVMESMNNGTPVIAFQDAGGTPELLSDNCGVVVPFLDTEAMAKELLSLLADRERYELIVNKARKRIVEDYDFEKYMGFLLELLNKQSIENETILTAALESCHQIDAQHSVEIIEQINKTQENITQTSPIAVIIHLFYFELWEEIKLYIKNIEQDYDLYVSISDKMTKSQLDVLLNDYPNIRLFRLENKGRDIYPFLHIFKQISSLNYQYICKIHSKKSTHTEIGESWRKNIFEALLGSKQQVSKILKHLDQNPETGIISPKQYLLKFHECTGYNEQTTKQNMSFIEAMLKTLKTEVYPDDTFVTGSMFWFRPQVFQPLVKLDIQDTDYPPEQGQIDGTIMHAIERILVICARLAGYKAIDTASIDD